MNNASRIGLLFVTAAAAASACTLIIGPIDFDGTTGSTTGAGGTGGSDGGMPPLMSADKVDLLLMVDNSRSMADKQLILALAIPDLVKGLVNPSCVDAQGTPGAMQPPGPLDPCPSETKRLFAPITDLHIGVIDSSLGGHGSDACSIAYCNNVGNELSNNDAGHLLSRVDGCSDKNVPRYNGENFLAWDPTQKLVPVGEKNLGSITTGDLTSPDVHLQVVTSTPGLVASFKDLVVGVDQVGCGYESQLESWYRFLVDPEPYQSISVNGDKSVLSGIDDVLLEQRRSFLRPSSLLAIVMLTDENDCSVKDFEQFYYALQQKNPQDSTKTFHLPRARKECQTNPNDPCCKSCGQTADGCPTDDTCKTKPTLIGDEDDPNLRCFDQKRRFGIDFLYPIDRYTAGLTSPTVPNRQGDMVGNPLFTDLNTSDSDTHVRGPGLVFFTGIVGVPWQDIAHVPGELNEGLKNAEELAAASPNGTTWDMILGDPANNVMPKDSHMIESIQPRPGLPPPGSAIDADPISGHEYSIPKNDDLQYACVFNLKAASHDCSGAFVACDCSDPTNDSPLCDPSIKTTQIRAKAYPAIRELSLLKSLGPQGVVGSVCSLQISDPAAADYGYRPVVELLLERVKGRLVP